MAFDPANPDATRGSIVVDTGIIMVAKKKMRDPILSLMWLDAKKISEMKFELFGGGGYRKVRRWRLLGECKTLL